MLSRVACTFRRSASASRLFRRFYNGHTKTRTVYASRHDIGDRQVDSHRRHAPRLRSTSEASVVHSPSPSPEVLAHTKLNQRISNVSSATELVELLNATEASSLNSINMSTTLLGLCRLNAVAPLALKKALLQRVIEVLPLMRAREMPNICSALSRLRWDSPKAASRDDDLASLHRLVLDGIVERAPVLWPFMSSRGHCATVSALSLLGVDDSNLWRTADRATAARASLLPAQAVANLVHAIAAIDRHDDDREAAIASLCSRSMAIVSDMNALDLQTLLEGLSDLSCSQAPALVAALVERSLDLLATGSIDSSCAFRLLDALVHMGVARRDPAAVIQLSTAVVVGLNSLPRNRLAYVPACFVAANVDDALVSTVRLHLDSVGISHTARYQRIFRKKTVVRFVAPPAESHVMPKTTELLRLRSNSNRMPKRSPMMNAEAFRSRLFVCKKASQVLSLFEEAANPTSRSGVVEVVDAMYSSLSSPMLRDDKPDDFVQILSSLSSAEGWCPSPSPQQLRLRSQGLASLWSKLQPHLNRASLSSDSVASIARSLAALRFHPGHMGALTMLADLPPFALAAPVIAFMLAELGEDASAARLACRLRDQGVSANADIDIDALALLAHTLAMSKNLTHSFMNALCDTLSSSTLGPSSLGRLKQVLASWKFEHQSQRCEGRDTAVDGDEIDERLSCLLTPYLHSDARSRPSPSKFHSLVSRHLHELGVIHALEYFVDELGVYVDVFINDSKIVLEVDGPKHHMTSLGKTAYQSKIVGTHRLRERLLRACGYHVVCMDVMQWRRLKSSHQRQQWLQGHIDIVQ